MPRGLATRCCTRGSMLGESMQPYESDLRMRHCVYFLQCESSMLIMMPKYENAVIFALCVVFPFPQNRKYLKPPPSTISSRCGGLCLWRHQPCWRTSVCTLPTTELYDQMIPRYQPEYVIYEPMHNSEQALETVRYMDRKRYKLLNNRGWNQIYERISQANDGRIWNPER